MNDDNCDFGFYVDTEEKMILLKEAASVIHVCHKSNPSLSCLYHHEYVMEKGRLIQKQ